MKGSTIKRGNTWTAYWFTTDPATGKRRQHSKGGFETQKAARGHLNDLLGKVQAGEWKPDTKLTVKQLLEEHWLPAKVASGKVRPSTESLYRRAINDWVVPRIGAVEVRTLTPATMAALSDGLRSAGKKGGGGLSPRSVQIAVGVVKAATAWATRNDLLNRDPVKGFERPKVTSPTMQSWTVAEARAFLAGAKGDRMEFAWALLLTRGLRRGELCGLRWDAVDLDAGRLQIVRTRILVDGRAEESLPKTDAGRRAVPLDPSLVALLRRHWATQASEKLAAGGAYEDAGWLVADELGKPYYPDTISEWFDDKTKALGLRRIRLHDTRHTAASLMLAAGVPVKVVAEMLGHDPPVTLATYAHVIPGMGEQAGAALSAALLG